MTALAPDFMGATGSAANTIIYGLDLFGFFGL
jgi:hypothetical protein